MIQARGLSVDIVLMSSVCFGGMSHPYRCTHANCRRRVTLRKPREWYVRKPRCPGCGRTLKGQRDSAMRARDKRRACYCGKVPNSRGYAWPHRRGSIKFCEFSREPLTDDDFEELFRRLKSQRRKVAHA